MCFAPDARPPELPAELAPVAGGAGAELLELTSADGSSVSAAFAEAPDPRGPAVVVLPDIRGLFGFYAELTERFAAAGHHAVAIDWFGRTLGPVPASGDRGPGFEPRPYVRQTRTDEIQADAAAAAALVRERTGETRVAVVGFCFGGSQALLCAAEPALPFAGTVAFYGGLDGSRLGFPSPPERAERMRGPILGLYGGGDEKIPLDQLERFERRLAAAGVEHEIVVYPGAPHSFFDRAADEHAEACADAWRRVIAFLAALGSERARYFSS